MATPPSNYRTLILKTVAALLLGSALTACAHSKKHSKHARNVAGGERRISSDESNSFDAEMKHLGLKAYVGNVHAHHFMTMKMSKKQGGQRVTAADLQAGPCVIGGSFPEDDARPCRENASGENVNWIPTGPDLAREKESPGIAYYAEGCRYAREAGGLDFLFVSPHTKNNQNANATQGTPTDTDDDGADLDSSAGAAGGPIDTDTRLESLLKMAREIDPIREANGKSFVCGLAQEASSISSGNHINIFGQFSNGLASPLFFPSGRFDVLYPEIAKHRTAGEKIVIQMNHPDTRGDIYWGPVSNIAKASKLKTLLNDYGLDDYAPVGCIIKRALKNAGKDVVMPEDCDGVTDDKISYDSLAATFAKIREVSGDPFRLIEVINPGGATTNAAERFRSVHNRTRIDDIRSSGINDYLFYLAMGFKLSPSANQDNHFMNYGSATASRTGILAPMLSDSAIIDAFEARRTYASEDRNAQILVEAAPEDGTIALAGDEISVAQARLKVRVGYKDPDSTDGSVAIRIYKYSSADPIAERVRPKFADLNGQTTTLKSGEVTTLELPLDIGEHYFFVEFTQTNDLDRIYSAPIWVSAGM